MDFQFDPGHDLHCEEFVNESLGILDPNVFSPVCFSHEDIRRESLASQAYNNILSNPLLEVVTPRKPSTSGLLLKDCNELQVSTPKQVLTLMEKLSELPEVFTPTSFNLHGLGIPSVLPELRPAENFGGDMFRVSTPPRGSTSSATSELNTAFLWHPRRGSLLNSSALDELFINSPSYKKGEIDTEKEDLVLLEARHIATKLASDSFLEDDDDQLNTTEEPVGFSSLPEEQPIKCDTKTVFKNIDKLFTPLPLNSHEETDNSQYNEQSPPPKTKVAKLVRRLSEILDTASPTQKNEGQDILCNLAQMYFSDGSKKSRSFSVDYTPSFESEPATQESHVYEALDLRKSPADCNANHVQVQPLDLSGRSKKSFVSPKILPSKYNNLQKSVIPSSFSSVSSNESKTSVDLKLRPRRPEEKPAKKGPMRAVLSMDNMSKQSGPLKFSPKISRIQKKATTPIKSPKPIAQSTPENQRTSLPISPIAGPNSSQIKDNGKLIPRRYSEGQKQTVIKRSSSGDLKKIQNGTKPFVRSHSLVGKSPALGNCNSNIVGSKSVVKESITKSIKRPSLLNKLGKENKTK